MPTFFSEKIDLKRKLQCLEKINASLQLDLKTYQHDIGLFTLNKLIPSIANTNKDPIMREYLLGKCSLDPYILFRSIITQYFILIVRYQTNKALERGDIRIPYNSFYASYLVLYLQASFGKGNCGEFSAEALIRLALTAMESQNMNMLDNVYEVYLDSTRYYFKDHTFIIIGDIDVHKKIFSINSLGELGKETIIWDPLLSVVTTADVFVNNPTVKEFFANLDFSFSRVEQLYYPRSDIALRKELKEINSWLVNSQLTISFIIRKSFLAHMSEIKTALIKQYRIVAKSSIDKDLQKYFYKKLQSALLFIRNIDNPVVASLTSSYPILDTEQSYPLAIIKNLIAEKILPVNVISNYNPSKLFHLVEHLDALKLILSNVKVSISIENILSLREDTLLFVLKNKVVFLNFINEEKIQFEDLMKLSRDQIVELNKILTVNDKLDFILMKPLDLNAANTVGFCI